MTSAPGLAVLFTFLAFPQFANRTAANTEPPWPPAQGTARVIIDWNLRRDSSLKGFVVASDVVMEGTVANVLPSRIPGFGSVETDSRIAVVTMLKGAAELKEVTVSQIGGTIGNFSLVAHGYAMMHAGEHYVFFLTRDSRPSTPQNLLAPPFSAIGGPAGLVLVRNGIIYREAHSLEDIQHGYNGMALVDFLTELKKIIALIGPQ